MRKESFIHPRDEIMRTMDRIYRYRMTTTSGGNISLREEDGAIWITPAGVDKGNLRREDIVCVRPDGSVEGRHRPSSELPFHRKIYEARSDLRAIVHAHAVALVAFSITRQVPNTLLFHQAWRVCGQVAFVPYALPGSDKLGERIARAFAAGADCAVLENHGVVVGGRDLQQAFQRFETLEFVAKTIIKARLLGEVRYLDRSAAELGERVTPLDEFEREPPTNREKELRRELAEFMRRGYQQRLFISTAGSFSARVDEDSFIITPFEADRHALRAEDFVLIRGGKCEAGKRPSRASRNHQAIYARHPEVGAILNASPVNAMAFGVTDAPLDSRTIPESYLLLRDIARIPYGVQFVRPDDLAARVSVRAPVALLENDGALVLGRSILEAFDRLEVLESTAESLINGRLLGVIAPMSDETIEELKRRFAIA